MDTQKKKKLKRMYLETKKHLGVYKICVEGHDQCILASSKDLDAVLNRHRTEFRFGTHRNKALQKLWNEKGAEAFTFEVVDSLEPLDEPDYDPSDDLEELLEMWTEKATEQGYTLY